MIRVCDLNTYVATILMHKLVNRKLPSLFDEMFIKSNEIQKYSTRQRDHFHVPIYKTIIGNNFIIKVGTNIWNSVVSKECQLLSLGQIKKDTKVGILSNY